MQAHNPRIVTDGLICHLDPTNGGKGGSKILAKPTQISDCILWLDADDAETVVTSGANITNWLDKSGKGNHAEDHGGAEYPQYDSSRINGRKVVNFVYPDVLKGAFASGSQPFSGSGGTVFTIFKQNSFAGGVEYAAILELAQGAYLSGSYGNRMITSLQGAAYSADKILQKYNASDVWWPIRIENGPPVIACYTNDSTHTINYGNGQVTGTVGYYAEDLGDDARTYYCLGDDMTSGDHFNGYMCEIIIYNKVLSDAERQSVEYYLSRKWAIPLKNRAVTNLADGDRVGELFPNGDFPSGLSDGETGYDNGDGTLDGWGLENGSDDLSVVSDTLWGRGLRITKQHAGSYANGYINVSNLTAGSTYKASVDYNQQTSSQVRFNYSGSATGGHTGSGTYTVTWVEPGTSQAFYNYVYGTDTVYADFSNFSVVEVGGNTSASTKPVETTNKNTFYFPNPNVDNCDLRLEENEISVADNLPWTMEFWIKRHARGDLRSVYSGIWGNTMASGKEERLQFYANGTYDKLILVDDGNNNSSTVITNSVDIDCLHKWRHVVLAFDGTTTATTAGCVRQYVDGQDKGPAIALPNVDSKITIRRLASRGSTSDAHRLEGELGNFRVYNKQLSHAEVLQNYNAQRAKYQNKKMSFAAPGNLKLYLDAQSGTSSNYYANGTWYDISGGTAHNATRANATFTDAGVKYYDFDGTGDYFTASDSSDFTATVGNELTVSVWLRFDSSPDDYEAVLGKWDNNAAATKEWLFRFGASDVWEFRLLDGDNNGSIIQTSSAALSTGEWHHIVGTYAGGVASGTMVLYKDGEVFASSFSTSGSTFDGMNNTASLLAIGALQTSSSYSDELDGGIANVMIYNKALSADEVAQNHNYFKHRFGK